MTPMVRPLILAGCVAIFPVMVEAQGHAGMASGGHVMAAAPHVMVAAAPRPMAHAAPGVIAQSGAGARMAPRIGFVRTAPRLNSRNTRRPGGTGRNFNTEGRTRSSACRSGVPGLGFDEVHLAAICPNGIGSGGFGAGSPFFFPYFDNGFYMPSVPVDEAAGAADAQQQEVADADYREAGRRMRDVKPEATVAESDQTAIQDSEQYVFVRRDGTVFFAVAYAWENGTLRYVTSEGLRRNISKTALDLDATQQFNEQRGLSFHLPA